MAVINYDRRGSGPTVVLIHGIGSRWQVFAPIIDLLAVDHDVIAVDLPGFGASPADRAVTASPAGYAQRMGEFLDGLGVVRPHVVGNSMGGGIALELGRRGAAGYVTAFSPIGFWRTAGRVWCQGLVTAMRLAELHACTPVESLLRPEPTRGVLLSAFYGRGRQVPADVAIADVRGLAGATMFEQARHEFTGYRFPGDHGHLAEVPVTIAWGTRDVLLTHRTQSRRARRELPQARHVDLPGCGHLPFSDDPQLCADTIRETESRG